MENELAQLNLKVDQLTDQMQILTDYAAREQRRRQNLQELQDDLIPIGNQLIQMTITELEDVGSDFELEDLLYLLKRVLRNTELILAMFDRVEALMGIIDEMDWLGKEVFSTTVHALDDLERKGYFLLARSGWGVLEELVEKLDPKDIEDLSESLDPALDLTKKVLAPEMLEDLQRALTAFQSPVPNQLSGFLGLLKEMNDPGLKRGLARLIEMLKALDPQYQTSN